MDEGGKGVERTKLLQIDEKIFQISWTLIPSKMMGVHFENQRIASIFLLDGASSIIELILWMFFSLLLTN